jgi:hypothetical protein
MTGGAPPCTMAMVDQSRGLCDGSFQIAADGAVTTVAG